MGDKMSRATGGSVGYYSVRVDHPTTGGNPPYLAECNDIIEALGMSYAEGNAFKALWRSAAARTLGVQKQDYPGALYDAEKVVFFGRRLVAQLTDVTCEAPPGNYGYVYLSASAADPYMPTDDDWLNNLWANWSMIGVCGDHFLFEREPVDFTLNGGITLPGGRVDILSSGLSVDDWRNSKRQRPEHLK